MRGLLLAPPVRDEQRRLRALGAQLDGGAGVHAGDAQRDELHVGAVVAVAVALLVQRAERLAQLRGRCRTADGQLVRLSAVAQLAGDLDAGLAFGAQRLDGGV